MRQRQRRPQGRRGGGRGGGRVRVAAVGSPAAWVALLKRSEAARRAVVALFRSEASQASSGAERCLSELSRERRFASLNFAKVDMGAHEGFGGLARAAGVGKTPAFVVFQGGKVVHRSEGFLGTTSASQLARALAQYTRPLSARERLVGLAGDAREALVDAGRAVLASPAVAAVVRRPLRAALAGAAAAGFALALTGGAGAVRRLLRRRRRAAVEARARARHGVGAGEGEEEEILGLGGAPWRRERERLRRRDLVERFRAEGRIRREGWAAAKRAQVEDFAHRTAAQLDRLERGSSLARVRELELQGVGRIGSPGSRARRAAERLDGVAGGVVERDSSREARLRGSRAQASGGRGAVPRGEAEVLMHFATEGDLPPRRAASRGSAPPPRPAATPLLTEAPEAEARRLDRRRDWVAEVKHRFGEFSPRAVRAWQRDLTWLMCLRPDVPHVEVDWERYAAGEAAAAGGERALQSLRAQLVLRTGVDPETLAFNPRLAEEAWEEYNELLVESFLTSAQLAPRGAG